MLGQGVYSENRKKRSMIYITGRISLGYKRLWLVVLLLLLLLHFCEAFEILALSIYTEVLLCFSHLHRKTKTC